MKRAAVILYGPPASGKDTVTAALQEMDRRYLLHRRFKVGSGRSASYRVGTRDALERMRAADRVLYENERYGNIYAFDARALEDDFAEGVPVLHVGQLAGVRRLSEYPASWVLVALWCSRATTEARAAARGSTDVAQRLAAWNETDLDYRAATAKDFDLTIDTDLVGPAQAASAIHSRVLCAIQ